LVRTFPDLCVSLSFILGKGKEGSFTYGIAISDWEKQANQMTVHKMQSDTLIKLKLGAHKGLLKRISVPILVGIRLRYMEL